MKRWPKRVDVHVAWDGSLQVGPSISCDSRVYVLAPTPKRRKEDKTMTNVENSLCTPDVMTTVTIQIGNSDDKLSQEEWSKFVDETGRLILQAEVDVHFFGAAPNYARWQNAAWVIAVRGGVLHPSRVLSELKVAIADLRASFRQDSVAWTEGVTEFA